MTDDNATSAPQTATEAYFAQYGPTPGIPTAAIPTASPATGNQTATAVALPSTTPAVTWAQGATAAASLRNAGFLHAVPTNYYIASDDSLFVATTLCGTVGAAAG